VLNKKEIIEIASIKGIKPFQQEKHYIQTLILNVLSDYLFVFKGETYLWFFHGLDRFSTDLDFTIDLSISSKEFKDIKSFSNNLNKKINNMLWILDGVKSECKIINLNEYGFSLKISVQGPLYTSEKSLCFVDVDISYREEILLPTVSFSLDFPAYNLPIKIIRYMDLREILAEKIRAVYTRKKGRDIYDIYFLISKKNLVISKEVINLVNKKLSFSSNKLKFTFPEFKSRLYSLKDIFSKDMYEIKFSEINNFDFYYQFIIDNVNK
jgi:hypothetical protein